MGLFDAESLSSAPVRSVLNPGKYQCRIVKAVEMVSKNKGTPGIDLQFVVVVGPVQENNSDPANHNIFGQIYSSNDPSKRGTFYSKMHSLADAADIDLAQYVGMSSEEFTPMFLDSLINCVIVVDVDNETYNGNLKETIKSFSKV